MNLLNNLKDFFDKNYLKSGPVLLALSGGSDSRCLFELLKKIKDQAGIELHIAHVDHSWRQVSEKEAESLKKEIEEIGLPFHFKKLKILKENNIEEYFRNERYSFFKSLFEKHKFEALILAHHKDDLVETILKRLFEGSNLYNIHPMKEVSFLESIKIFRPLLNVSKKDILKYLHENNIAYFSDLTNEDTKYLRARMRKEIVPYLNEKFQKKIDDNLVALSSNSYELNEYLSKKTSKFLKNLKKNKFGVFLDCNEIKEIVEVKYILKKISLAEDIDLSRDILNKMTSFLLEKKANQKILLKNATIYIDRGCFFIINDIYDKEEKRRLLKNFKFGPWELKVTNVKKIDSPSSWRDFFSKSLTLYVPEGKYNAVFQKKDKRLKKLFENKKVPAFLRNTLPVLYDEKSMPYDFLSGKNINKNFKQFLKIEVILK
ncbi:MAG: tRNA lysidine(34) synthetase TilS [Parachlamydiales bacterium]|nr:tRNA lysidine(34) synthetase TilS [Parachlamydiales bacterium]